MKKKILIIIALIVTAFTTIKTISITYSFLNFAKEMLCNETSLIKDILLNSPENINSIKLNQNINNITIENSAPKNKLFFNSKKMEIIVYEKFKDKYLKITYNATILYKQILISILQIVILAFISLIIIILTINYFLNPYLDILEQINISTKNILKGDFSYQIKTDIKGETKEFVDNYNQFLNTLKESFGVIEEKYTSLIEKEKSSNPLKDAKETIEYLADIVKFKRLIEEDINTKDIFNRLIEVIDHFNIKNFAIITIDTNEKHSNLIYSSKENICCNVIENYQNCRAFRTKKEVNSIQFEHICPMHTCSNDYICIPFNSSGTLNVILKINIEKNKEEILNKLPYIKAYLNEVASIIESKHNLELLNQQNVKDALTKLFNRRYLENIMPTILAAANRNNDKIGFLMIDMDDFKKVNDTYGHDAGDIALKTLAQTLLSSVRKSDIVIRFGGEEFLIILQNIKDIKGLLTAAEKIRKNVENTLIDLGEKQIKKTISIGATLYPILCSSTQDCIKQADIALYEAKKTGKNKVVLYNSDLKKS